MRIRFSSEARSDRREAEAYYRQISAAVSRAFRRELMAALNYLIEYPEGAPVLDDDFRAKVLRGFPYSLIYRVSRAEILVLAVANQHRDPALVLDRLR